ncbi:TraB/GumN family protein [Ahrensia sp. 13_GOM-1096m]|uniref:TraB/GumN family protein n=1 Tax=Ahrensia sp. 13_GOM-1096m TaxID=1380380 RepID=UPI00055892D7|nr:TraB/GumN family protein [Ahrensia sp. 13_GOM-1096m]
MKTHHTRTAAIVDRISDASLVIIGAIHATVLAVTMLLAFTATQAKAEAPAKTCGGNNLMQKFAADNPERFAAIESEAAKVPFGEGLLFKLEKDGSAPSYLFGTMHMTDPRVISLPKAAQAALDGADIVAIESTEILDPAAAQVALMAKPELTMFVDDKRLSDFLNEEEKVVLAKNLAERGMQLALIDRMKPWLLTGMFALPECEFERKQAGEPFLDLALAQSAEKDGKELVGLETLIEQFDAMASLPMKFHVKGLIDTLALGDTVKDVTETMIILYTEGKTGTVWPMLRAVSDMAGQTDTASSEGYAQFEETMVNTRNKTMLKRSTPLLERGNAFIAVGALHLPGENGLAQLYKDAGYTVTAVQ